MNRRKFISNSIKLGVGLAIPSIYSWQIEPEWVEFNHQKIPKNSMNKSNSNRILIQISDLHIGNRFNYDYILKAFEKVKTLLPDFVVYTGDFIQYEGKEQLQQLEKVAQKMPKGKLATLAVLGNHDYGKDYEQNEVADQIIQILEKNEFTVLRNSQLKIASYSFVGIDDLWVTNFNPGRVISKLNKNVTHIILCHNPDAYDNSLFRGLKGIMLSGHTHEGQVKAPILPPFVVPVKNKLYTSGWIHKNKKLKLYINRGIGNLWKFRFNVRPEITIFTGI